MRDDDDGCAEHGQTNQVDHQGQHRALVRGGGAAGVGAEIRQITDRNAAGVKQTRGGTDDLRRRAQALAALVDQPAPRKTNGRVPDRADRLDPAGTILHVH